MGVPIKRMIKDSQMKPNITTEKCKSCSDVVFRLCDVYSAIKLVGKREERHVKMREECGRGETRETKDEITQT